MWSSARSLVAVLALLGGGAALPMAADAAVHPSAHRWSPVRPADPLAGSVSAVSCATAKACWLVDATGYAAHRESESSWGLPEPVDPTLAPTDLVSISCPKAQFCVAVSTDGRAFVHSQSDWTLSMTTPGSGGLDAVSCVTRSFCLAVDAAGHAYEYDGRSWSGPTTVDADRILTSVDCVSRTFCVAADQAGNALRYDGVWRAPEPVVPAASQVLVSCASSASCVLTANQRWAAWNGRRWGDDLALAPHAGSPVGSLSCPDPGSCLAMTRDGMGYRLVGRRWSIDDPGLGVDRVSVSCPTGARCLAVSSRGQASVWTDDAWSTPVWADPSRGQPTDVSCAGDRSCQLVDRFGAAAAYKDGAWSQSQVVSPSISLTSISCVTSTFCAAVGPSVPQVFVGYSPNGWVPEGTDPGGVLNDIACSSTTSCVAVDLEGRAIVLDGQTWSAPMPTGLSSIVAVSCGAPTFCLAVEQGGTDAATFDGTTWTLQRLPGGSTGGPVSCVSVSQCVTISAEGIALTFDGASWTSQPVGDAALIWSLSCPTMSFCLAGDVDGRVVAARQGTWAAPERLIKSEPLSVSCTFERFCVAVTPQGKSRVSSRA